MMLWLVLLLVIWVAPFECCGATSTTTTTSITGSRSAFIVTPHNPKRRATTTTTTTTPDIVGQISHHNNNREQQRQSTCLLQAADTSDDDTRDETPKISSKSTTTSFQPQQQQSTNGDNTSGSFFSNSKEDTSSSLFDQIQQTMKQCLRIIQESNQQGYSWKQTMANVLAGDYDQEALQAYVDATIAAAPCVLFIWQRSPSCISAIHAFTIMGIVDQLHIVRLDDPWEQGNPIRAHIGKQVGRSSVPMIFIGGTYVGGFDGGVSDQAPGIQAMAFQGTLRPALQAAGIVFPDNK